MAGGVWMEGMVQGSDDGYEGVLGHLLGMRTYGDGTSLITKGFPLLLGGTSAGMQGMRVHYGDDASCYREGE